jgi:hypothetical protein
MRIGDAAEAVVCSENIATSTSAQMRRINPHTKAMCRGPFASANALFLALDYVSIDNQK